MLYPSLNQCFTPRRHHPMGAAERTGRLYGRFRPPGGKNRAARGEMRCLIDVNSVQCALHSTARQRRTSDMTTTRAPARENGANVLVPEMLIGHVLMMR